MPSDKEYRVFDFGRYGQALALTRGERLINVVAIESSTKTNSIRTGKASADLRDRVSKALRSR